MRNSQSLLAAVGEIPVGGDVVTELGSDPASWPWPTWADGEVHAVQPVRQCGLSLAKFAFEAQMEAHRRDLRPQLAHFEEWGDRVLMRFLPPELPSYWPAEDGAKAIMNGG